MKTPVKLLFVEDDALDREAFHRMVSQKHLPYEVTTVETLGEARARLSESRFDTIIADYHLPDGPSTDLFDEAPETPFILLTGTLKEELALRTLQRGADDYLPKDEEHHHLEAVPMTVEKTLHRRHFRDIEQHLTQQLQESERLLEQKVAELQRAHEGLARRNEELAASRAQLEYERSLYRELFDFAPDGYIVTDLHGLILEANEAARTMLQSGVLHLPIFQFVTQQDQQKLLDLVSRFRNRATEKPESVEIAFSPPRREPIPCAIMVNAITDRNGILKGLRWLVRDMTERKQAEEALRRSEAHLAQAVHLAGLGTFEHDLVANLIECSPKLREISGFRPDEPVTLEALKRQIVPEDRERLMNMIRQANDPAGNGTLETEHRIVGCDGRVRWVHIRSQTFFEGDGRGRRPVRTVGAVRDVTERKEFQAELERLVAERTARLEEALAEMQHMSYSMIHDMRAPLRAMHNFAGLLSEEAGPRLKEEERDYLARISAACDRMDLLVTDALNYNKAVREELRLSPIDPARVLKGMLETYPKFQASAAKVQFEGEFQPVLANEGALIQCFSQLLDNAVKFVKPGQVPRVRIRAEARRGDGLLDCRISGTENPSPSAAAPSAAHSPAHPNSAASPHQSIHPPIQSSNQWVRIWVEDNGIGICREGQQRIFDMFQRMHGPEYEGTGIGLAIVRKLMDRMGGKLGVESEEGRGSRFWLELKAANPQRDTISSSISV